MKRYQVQEWKYVSMHPAPPEAGFVHLYNYEGEFYLMQSSGRKWRLLKEQPDFRLVADPTYTTQTNDDILLIDVRSNPVIITISNEFMALGKPLKIKDVYGNSYNNHITIVQEGGAKIDWKSSYIINQNETARTLYTDTLNYFVF